MRDAGVVHQQVDGRHARVHGVGEARHLARRRRRRPRGVETLPRPSARIAVAVSSRPGGVQVAEHQVRAAAREGQRALAPDAAAGAGDEHRAAAQVGDVHATLRRLAASKGTAPVPRSRFFSSLPAGLRGSGSSRELDELGHLEARQMRGDVAPHRGLAELRARARAARSPSRARRAPRPARRPPRLVDLGMIREAVLDLGAVHVLAAADDHVLLAVDDEVEALGVARSRDRPCGASRRARSRRVASGRFQ